MGRYTKAVCKLCRREGMKLFLKGDRCGMAKCAVEQGRPPPGMHGQGRGKLSDYGVQLREKQRVRRFYGMREGQFRLFFDRAARASGVTGERLLQMLEMRLDTLVYRMGFAQSRPSARQMVLHGHFLVNGRRADVPSMILGEGAVVSVRGAERSRAAVQRAVEATETRPAPGWVAVDRKELSGTVVRVPSREEIACPFNEQLVVELYSK